MATLLCRRILTRRVSNFKPINKFQFTNQIKLADTNRLNSSLFCTYNKHLPSLTYAVQVAKFSTKNPFNNDDENTKNLSIFQRFKQMYRDYWYVLVPVHIATSACWLGGFYYLAKSGVDVVAIMESWNISERIINPLKDSSMGYVAITYALYKIATPVRYTVTLGGTTVSINYLKKWGYIKPVPSREALSKIYQDRKETIIDTMKDKKCELIMKKEDMEKKLITKIKDSKDKFEVNKEDLLQLSKGLNKIKKESH